MDGGKYSPLGEFLKRHEGEAVVKTSFREIEDKLGFQLPKSAYTHRAWWSNNVSNSAMTKVWRRAGFRTERVDMKNQTLVFRRVKAKPAGPVKPPEISPNSMLVRRGIIKPDSPLIKSEESTPPRHPLIGALRGTIRIVAGTDLTKPADPEWGERIWGKQEK
jgi:hypothetical protein